MLSLVELNQRLISRARLITYVVAFVVALTTGSVYWTGAPNLLLANAFGYLSFLFLCLALVVTPVMKIWPRFALNGTLYMARRAFGVSAFVFALVHYFQMIFVGFGGDVAAVYSFAFGGNWPILAGILALFIFFLLAVTSFDFAVKKLGKRWFTLHKLVYLAYPFIVYHAYSIGVDFMNGQIMNPYALSFLAIALVTLVLELVRVYLSLSNKKV